MKIYGDLNFDSVGSLVQSGIAVESPDSLPTGGVIVGRLSFVDSRLYICVSVTEGVPAWVELTNEVNAYVFTQVSASTTWNIAHNLGSTTPAVQVYDTSGLQLFPDSITVIDANHVTIVFSDAEAGTAIIIAGPGAESMGGGGGGGGSALSSLTAATVSNAINSGNYAQIWNWALTGASTTGLTVSENVASTGGSGSQFLVEIATRAGSTANPLGVMATGNNALTISTTGAFLVGNSSLPGTSGQVLTSNGSAMPPSWTTPTPANGFPIEKQLATDGQTVFNTSLVSTTADSGTETYLEVFVNGVYQEQGASESYTVTGSAQVTFNYGLSINSNVVFISFA